MERRERHDQGPSRVIRKKKKKLKVTGSVPSGNKNNLIRGSKYRSKKKPTILFNDRIT